jgi:hypothetical protein
MESPFTTNIFIGQLFNALVRVNAIIAIPETGTQRRFLGFDRKNSWEIQEFDWGLKDRRLTLPVAAIG